MKILMFWMGGGHLREVVARGGSTVSLFCSKTINGKNVTKQGFCKILRTNSVFGEVSY